MTTEVFKEGAASPATLGLAANALPQTAPASEAPTCPGTEARLGRRVWHNFLSLAASTASGQAIQFLVMVYLARELTADGFGVLNFAQTFAGYFLLLGVFGLDTLGVREVARQPTRAAEYAGRVLPLRLSLASAAYLLLALVVLALPFSRRESVVVLLYGLQLFPAALWLAWVFTGVQQMHYQALAQALRMVLFGILVLLSVHGKDDLSWVPLANFLAWMVSVVFLLRIFVRGYRGLPWLWDAAEWGRSLRFGAPIFAALLLGQAYLFQGTLLLRLFQTPEIVGYYGAAFQFILLFSGLMHLYLQSIFPAIAALHQSQPGELPVFLGRWLERVLSVALPVGIGGVLLAPRLVAQMYGQAFLPAVGPLRLLMIGPVIMAVGVHFGNSLLACGFSSRYLRGVLLGASVSFAANLILIPHRGALGAAASWVFTEALMLVYMWRQFRQAVGQVAINRGYLVRLLAAGLGMAGLLTWALPAAPLWMAAPAGAATYGLLLVCLGVIPRERILALRALARRAVP